jgi:predicted ATPase/DNA-binding SARP family transcriptional activator/DNA-binding CsgD family transcriptional regulator
MAQARRSSGGLEPEDVRIWLLGGFRVSVGARSVEGYRWRLKKAEVLLKLLALARGHRLHREQIMAALWPDLDTRSATNNLHRVLHFARGALEPTPANTITSRYLALQGNLLALCPDGALWVDVEAFEGAAANARRGREPGAYRAAIELYTGELLPEDRYEEWTEEKREELRQLYLALLIELARLHRERKEYEPAIEAFRQVVAEVPAKEEAHVALMSLYALTGRRQEALLQYERLREALAEEFAEEPSATSRHLHEEIRAGGFPVALPSPSTDRPSEDLADSSKHNLPASLTSFVGREREMVEVKRSLSMTRLLTLTGAGGCGKTRLALEMARNLVGAYPGGVWLVELAPLSEPATLTQAVAQALGVREQPGRPLTETLKDYLHTKALLLILDNCEHLVESAASLAAALLRACPHLKVLATSREPLGVRGEVLWRVPPLSLPSEDQESSIESLMRYEAVQLFRDRTRSRLPGFELTEENASAAARVCRRLDGVPLAIELATARMGILAVEQITERLEDSLKLLSVGDRTADPRHRTLRATLAWSYELLTESERKLFGRISVFAGDWTLEAAEEVCSGNGIEREDVLDLLGRLVDKSLVIAGASPEEKGVLRYRMLDPVRQYGQERLQESGEVERVRERHAEYFLALAERVEPELSGARPVPWLELLETEYANLRATLSWALDGDEVEHAETGLRLAAALARFWDAHSPAEGRRWFEKGLARSGRSNTAVRARALNEAGFIAVYEGDPKGMALLEESLALYKELGDLSGAALSISNLGHAIVHSGDRARMVLLRDEVEALLSEPLDKRVRAHLLHFLGFAAGVEEDFEQMRVRIEESLALLRELGDVRNIASHLPILGMVVLIHGKDFERASELFEEGLTLQRELKYKSAIFFDLLGMAAVAALRGRLVRAAKLFGASEAVREDIGLAVSPLNDSYYDYDGYLATTRAGLSEEEFDAAFSEGRAMSPEQAIEYALSPEETSLLTISKKFRRTHTDKAADPLTRRQLEVALLIGRGLTNYQIADALTISKHTVANHVAQILRKLNLSSRSKIVVWVNEKRLRDSEKK